MELEIDAKVLSLIKTFETDVSKVISEALNLWLKEKIPICPITEEFCINVKGSCNSCSLPGK